MSKCTQGRQGDIYFKEVPKVPSEAKRGQSKILAYGEVTGHAHMLDATQECWQRYDVNDDIYISTGESAVPLVHDEHDTCTLAPNTIYKVWRQRQHDPLTSMPKPVQD